VGGTDVVEFVTYPNNPDGARNLTLQYPHAHAAYDLVYYWPSYTSVDAQLDLPVAFFSLGKLAGFAGSHFGWAVVRDKALAQRLAAFIDQAGGQSVDSRARALALLRHINANSDAFFSDVKSKLSRRWAELASVLESGARKGRFTITNAAHEGLYAYIRCEQLDATHTCQDVFARAGLQVNGPGGPISGVTAPYVRLTLCNYDSAWQLALTRMRERL